MPKCWQLVCLTPLSSPSASRVRKDEKDGVLSPSLVWWGDTNHASSWSCCCMAFLTWAPPSHTGAQCYIRVRFLITLASLHPSQSLHPPWRDSLAVQNINKKGSKPIHYPWQPPHWHTIPRAALHLQQVWGGERSHFISAYVHLFSQG